MTTSATVNAAADQAAIAFHERGQVAGAAAVRA